MRIVPDRSGGVPNIFSFHKRGDWFHSYLENPSMAYTAYGGRLYTVPLYVGEDVPIDGIRIDVIGTANAHARIGIYANAIGKNAMPGKLIYQTPQLDCSGANGYRGEWWQANTRPLFMLKGGRLYWLALLTDIDFSVRQSSQPPVWPLGFVGIEEGTDPRPVTYLYYTMAYGTLPDPYPGPTGFGSYILDTFGYGPVVWLRAAYKQAFNVTFGLAPGATAYMGEVGLFGGGIAGSNSAEIDGIRFTTEVTHNPSATLSLARAYLGAVHSSARGYWAGGLAGSNTNEIDGIQFDTEMAINPGATLSLARRLISGVHSTDRGYFGGGYTSGGVNEIDGIRFDTEAAINPNATLSNNRRATAGVNSSTRGYWGGGWDTTYSVEIDGINFSDETAVNPATALVTARQGLVGVNNPGTCGYFCTGYDGSTYGSGEIDGINFADETLRNPTAQTFDWCEDSGGVNSTLKAYLAAGYSRFDGQSISKIDTLQFSDETTAFSGQYLTVARRGLAGVQTGGIA